MILALNLDQKLKLTSKHINVKKKLISYQQTATSLSFSQFMANLPPSTSWIPDAWSIKLICSLIVTFYLTEPANRTKKSLTALLLLFWVKLLFLPKKNVLQKIKKSDINKINEVLVIKGIFSELNVCVYFHRKFQVSNIILTSWWQGGWGANFNPFISKRTPKKPTLIRW